MCGVDAVFPSNYFDHLLSLSLIVTVIVYVHIRLPAPLLFQRCKAAVGWWWPRDAEQPTELSWRYLAAAAAATDDSADNDGGGGGGTGPTDGR